MKTMSTDVILSSGKSVLFQVKKYIIRSNIIMILDKAYLNVIYLTS